MPRPTGLAQRPPLAGVEGIQLLEREAPPHSGRDVPRHERSLHQERAAPAHRIEQRLLRGPARQPQNAGREILAQGRLGGGRAKPALEERLARRVEIEGHVLVVQKRVNADIRPARVHVGTGAGGLAEAIADRVLDPERDEIQALQRALLGADLHLDRATGGKPFVPGQVMRGLKNIMLIAVGAVKDAPQDTAGNPAVEIDHVTEGKRAGKGHPAGDVRRILRAQLLQLGAQHGLQPSRAGRKEGLVLLTHAGTLMA